MIFHHGKIAETYNIGGFNEWKDIDIINVVKDCESSVRPPERTDMDLITYVTDRSRHDMHAIDYEAAKEIGLGTEPTNSDH